ncbi:protein FAM98B isoform X2 [Garra rufa]|uniref:protein FAM98B isoform X2 n=1 Tax=Garra rufa TaxID=137080 RepID=UPI003CCE8191
MERDTGAITLIKSLGYKSKECLKKCKCDELPCPLLTWLVSELRASCPDIPTRHIGGAVLVGELREVLKEMSCPQNALISEPLSPLLLFRVTEYLVSELVSAHVLTYKETHPEDTEQSCESKGKEQRKRESHNKDEHQEISPAQDDQINWKDVNKDLAELFQTLGLETSSQISDACAEVKLRMSSLPDGEVPEALLKFSLNSEQWERSALLSSMKPFTPFLESSVSIAKLLATREDESRIRPVKAGPSTAVHKVLMGSVPDRGGRPGEIEPPMPSFTGRREGGGSQQYRKRRREFSGKKKKNKQN